MLFTDAWALTPTKTADLPDVLGYWWRTDSGETVLLAASLSPESRTFSYRDWNGGSVRTATLAPFELRRIVPN